MFEFLLRRIASIIPTLVVVSMLIFGLQQLLPGDPALVMAGEEKDPAVIEQIRKQRPLPLVVFGHMHHTLRRQRGERRSFLRDRHGTAYLNSACVPRHGRDQDGRMLRHFSWVVLAPDGLRRVSHRWYGCGGELHYEQLLWSASAPC
jgi:uncharacterized protein (TIGR04168 family)